MNKSRVETLTDGIIAIAATIMVLELAVPTVSDWSGLLEIGHTFLAYVISFLLIYIGWAMHHDLFHKAEVLSRKAFLINGIWVFFLTLVPFTTRWIGVAPDSTVPEFFNALNLLLWNIAFHWLSHQVYMDNPETVRKHPRRFNYRIFLYITFILCIILAFIKPVFSNYLLGIATLVLFIWSFRSRKKQKK